MFIKLKHDVDILRAQRSLNSPRRESLDPGLHIICLTSVFRPPTHLPFGMLLIDVANCRTIRSLFDHHSITVQSPFHRIQVCAHPKVASASLSHRATLTPIVSPTSSRLTFLRSEPIAQHRSVFSLALCSEPLKISSLHRLHRLFRNFKRLAKLAQVRVFVPRNSDALRIALSVKTSIDSLLQSSSRNPRPIISLPMGWRCNPRQWTTDFAVLYHTAQGDVNVSPIS